MRASSRPDGLPFLPRRTCSVAAGRLDLRSFQVRDVAGAQSIPIGYQDFGGIPMPATAAAGLADKLSATAAFRIAAGTQFDGRPPFAAWPGPLPDI